jgi:hypothetical protein
LDAAVFELENNIMEKRIDSVYKTVLVVVALPLLIQIRLYGQTHDFQTWSQLDLVKDLTEDLRFSLEIGQRLKENSLTYDRTLFTGKVSRAFSSGFDLTGGARYYLVSDSEHHIVSRYRLNGDVSWERDIGGLTAGLRQRFQYGFDDIVNIGDYAENSFKSRSRIEAAYLIPGTPVTLGSSYEFFLGIFRDEGIYPVEYRFKLGSEILLSPRTQIEIAYMLENELNVVEPVRAHVLLLFIEYTL